MQCFGFQWFVCISSRNLLLTYSHAKKSKRKKLPKSLHAVFWFAGVQLQIIAIVVAALSVKMQSQFTSISFLSSLFHCLRISIALLLWAFCRTEQNTLLPSDYHDYGAFLIFKLTVQRLKFLVPLPSVGDL